MINMARDTAGSMAWQVNASEILQAWLSQLDAGSIARPRSHRIVGFAVYQMYQNARTPWFIKWARWHCSQIKFTRLASSSAPTKYMKIASSSASTKGFGGFWERNGESLEGRRTHARSVIIVTINRETCGHWIQILKNAHRCVVFVQSAPWHPKRLILHNVTCSVNETPSSCHIQPTSFYGQLGKEKNTTSTAKRGEDTEHNDTNQKFGRMRVWQISSSSHFGTNEVHRKGTWQWAHSKAMGWGRQECGRSRLSQWSSLQISPNPTTEAECHPFLSTCHHHACQSTACVSFWGQGPWLFASKSEKNVGECMLGFWMVECSKVSTQHKRWWAGLNALLALAGQKCKK